MLWTQCNQEGLKKMQQPRIIKSSDLKPGDQIVITVSSVHIDKNEDVTLCLLAPPENYTDLQVGPGAEFHVLREA
jgi:hypothetical protein